MSAKKAMTRVIFWFDLALFLAVGIFFFMGRDKSFEFIGGYIIEQSLSIDNLFVFIMIFTGFGIKPKYQRRILNYGITGACILRLLFIVLGITVVNKFHWVLYVFGALLIISGLKMLVQRERIIKMKDSKAVKLLSFIIPVIWDLEGDRFFIKKKGILYATPLFAILIVIEFTDIIFAVDSIPAIFSITTNPFIVYTSNILAILGLRNMYFLLGKLHEKFRYVKYGVASILVFTGVKLFVLMFDMHITIEWSLFLIFIIMGGSIVASMALKLEAEP